MSADSEINPPLWKLTSWIEDHPRLIAAIIALLFAVQITPEFKMSPDGVSYMSIARSIVEHGRFERLGSPHLRYAPGYPVFITPAFFFDHPFIPVQILQWIYTLLLFWGVYAWSRLYIGKSAIWIAVFTLVNAGYWDLFRAASAEMVFTPGLIWAGYFLARLAAKPRSIGLLIASIVFAAIACATRQLAIMLVPGFCAALLIRTRAKQISLNRAVILAAVFTILIGAVSYALIAYDHWGAKQKEAAGDTGYTSVFFQPDRPLAGQIAEGLRRQSAEIGRLLIPGMFREHGHEHDFTDLHVWIYAAVFIPIAIGWWRFARATADPLALTFPFYFALCVAYPYDSGTRFTVPVFAIVAVSAWFLLKGPVPFIKGSRPLYFLILVVIHIAVSVGFWVSDVVHVHRRYKAWPDMQRVAAEIPPDAKVLAMRGAIDDRWMFLMWFTDRPVAYETTGDPIAPFVDCIVTARSEPDSRNFKTMNVVGDYRIEKITMPELPLTAPDSP